MGCDIHMVFERQDTDGKAWIGVVAVDALTVKLRPAADDRYYSFFAALAGVRGEGPKPLGIPNDVSDLAAIQISHWNGDGHSHSYLPADEFCRRYRSVSADAETRDDEILGVYMDKGDRWRVVFWFDN